MIQCFLHKTADQTIGTSANTLVTWDSTSRNDLGMWTPGASSRITIPSGYDYAEVMWNLSWDTNTSTDRWVRLLKDGALAAYGASSILQASNNERTRQHGCCYLPLGGTGCYLEVDAWQNTGADRDIVGGSTPVFIVRLLVSP